MHLKKKKENKQQQKKTTTQNIHLSISDRRGNEIMTICKQERHQANSLKKHPVISAMWFHYYLYLGKMTN